MDYQTSANPFLNIPERKLNDALDDILKQYSNNGVLTKEGALLTEVFQRYYASNIPVDYWWREMDNFIGPEKLKKYYDKVISSIKQSFVKGERALFAGNFGIGKTIVTSCILKRAVETFEYSALYVTLVDIIHIMLSSTPEVKNQARELLLNVDFLVIDELDPRFMGSDNAADLFGRILEPIMRTRIQNRMPLFFCTNSPNVEEAFSGALHESIKSLMNLVKLVLVVGGEDARMKIKKGEL